LSASVPGTSALEILKDVGAGAGAVSLAWNLAQYALGRRVKVDVTANPDRRDADGISIEVRNRSTQRSVVVRDVEVLHKPGRFRRRVAAAAGPLMEPVTPWHVAADSSTSGWVRLEAVDGSGMAPGLNARWNFARPIRVRLKLDAHRGSTSKRVSVKP
jgi:hypothetical protein